MESHLLSFLSPVGYRKNPPATPEPTTSDTGPVFVDYRDFVQVSLHEGKGQGLSSEATGVTAVVLGLISKSLGDGTNRLQPKEDLKAG